MQRDDEYVSVKVLTHEENSTTRFLSVSAWLVKIRCSDVRTQTEIQSD